MLPSLLLFVASAQAAPVVDPIADPDVDRVRLSSLADLRATRVDDSVCGAGDDCQAWDQRTLVGGEVQVAIVRGVAVSGSAGRVRARIDEADFDAVGLGWGLATKLAAPLTHSWWVAGQARLDGGRPSDTGPEGEKSDFLAVSATLELAWGDPDGGFVGHLGAQATPYWHQVVKPLGPEGLELDFSPRLPASAVVGLAFTSRPLGSPWTGAPRAVAHVDATAGQTMGVSAGLGLSF